MIFKTAGCKRSCPRGNGSGFVAPGTNKFVYDGWNLVAIVTSDLGLLTSFGWGQEPSGTMQGAGGIGGLVAVFEISNGEVLNVHFPCYDGNGNVMALVQTDGTVSALYEYGPFGEPIRVTGLAAKANPFHWSTKFTDEESGLVYYGCRYYLPIQGRWIGRDPIGESHACNLHLALLNSPVGCFDPDGQMVWGQKVRPIFYALASLLRPDGPSAAWAQRQAAEQARQAAMVIQAAIKKTRYGQGPPSGSGGEGPVRISGAPWAKTGLTVVIGLAVAEAVATVDSLLAAANLALGERSEEGSLLNTLESALLNYSRGEQAYGDLDAISAALMENDYASGGAIVALGTFWEVGEIFMGH
jgi:RHS repeat-associated protein